MRLSDAIDASDILNFATLLVFSQIWLQNDAAMLSLDTMVTCLAIHLTQCFVIQMCAMSETTQRMTVHCLMRQEVEDAMESGRPYVPLSSIKVTTGGCSSVSKRQMALVLTNLIAALIQRLCCSLYGGNYLFWTRPYAIHTMIVAIIEVAILNMTSSKVSHGYEMWIDELRSGKTGDNINISF